MEYRNLERVLGDPEVKEHIPVDPSEYPSWMRTWSDTSYGVDNFFNDDELDWLEDLMYRSHYSRRVKKNGTLHFNVDNRLIQDKFYDKLKTVIPELENEELWAGNFLITSTPYNLHIDTGNPHSLTTTNHVPGKQFIIPLWVCHTNKDLEGPPQAGTAIFKNRFLMYGTNFAKGDPRYDTNVFYTVRDYEALTCYDRQGNVRTDIDWNKQTVSDADYEKYFTHFNKKWLEGFELEAVHNWERGKLIVFDRCQAHSGVNFRKNNVTLKCGLSMMTTVKK
jgi:hypothetical protein